MYARLPSALLPKGPRAPTRGGATSNNKHTAAHGNNTGGRIGAVGAAAASRLTEFVRGVLGTTRGDRAATAIMESRLGKKVVHLDNAGPSQTEAQRAGAREGRGAGAVGLSGKQCKQMVSGVLASSSGIGQCA